VTLLNVGSWTGANCLEPEAAIASHMEEALAWASRRKKKGAKVVLRSASTMYRATGCRATNSFLRYANGVGRASLDPLRGQFLPTHGRSRLRGSSETCSPHDHHYSLHTTGGGGGGVHGRGYWGGCCQGLLTLPAIHYALTRYRFGTQVICLTRCQYRLYAHSACTLQNHAESAVLIHKLVCAVHSTVLSHYY